VKRLVSPVTSSSGSDVAAPFDWDCDSSIRPAPVRLKETPRNNQQLSGIERPIRHCEQSEAIQGVSNCGLVWIASLSLAMTGA
jgi:hypothetical protein